MEMYKPAYFDSFEQLTQNSAHQIVPILVEWFKPQSVVDVGCGWGTWLKTFQARGVSQILGLDDADLSEKDLKIPAQYFQKIDLNAPFQAAEKFDLAISLEVAEHLLPTSAEVFVNSLTKLSQVVVFSAAIPEQTGMNHIHLQWQSYWVQLFAQNEFRVWDGLRPIIWHNAEIAHYYRQNTLIFIQKDVYTNYSYLIDNQAHILDMVHPDMLVELLNMARNKIYYLEKHIHYLQNENQSISLAARNLWKGIRRKLFGKNEK
jgi:trans-aconitate methyltransferase